MEESSLLKSSNSNVDIELKTIDIGPHFVTVNGMPNKLNSQDLNIHRIKKY
jgi:hypothetical protein